MSIKVLRTANESIQCLKELEQNISDDVIITSVLEQIRLDDYVSLTFIFDVALDAAMDTQLDTLIADLVCPAPPVDTSASNVSVSTTPNVGEVQMWNGTQWVYGPQTSSSIGHQITFVEKSSAKNKWLDLYTDGMSGNATFGIMPFDSKLIGMTFTNSSSSGDADIEIHSAAVDNGKSDSTDLTWSIVDKRTARKTSFSSDITYSAGDKISIYIKDTGTDVKKVAVTLYFQTMNLTEIETSENFSGNF